MEFQDLPIKRKVTWVIVLTSVAVLLVSTAAFGFYDFISYRQSLERSLTALASVLARYGAEPVARADRSQAEGLLGALHSDPWVATAIFYQPQGQPLAGYRAPGTRAESLPSLAQAQQRADEQVLAVFEPVLQAGRPVGGLYLEFRGGHWRAWLRSYSALALGVLAVAMLTALALAHALQRRITGPILALADTVRRVSRPGDLALRAPRRGADEVGLLAESFNQMLARLQASESAAHFLAAIVVSSDAAIVGKDLEGNVVSWNAGAERMFGYTAEEMRQQSITRLVAPDRPDEERRILEEAKRGQIRQYETVRIHKSGRPVVVSLAVSPIYGEAGRIIGVSSIARDITAQKQAEEQIRRMNLELEERVAERTAALTAANRELEAFTYSVAHDLRGPLRHMESFSKILSEDHGAELSPEARRFLERIRQGSHQMSQLVDDLLNLARVGRLELKRRAVPLNRLVEEVLNDLKRDADGRHIEWRIASLPQVTCDPGLIKLVFVNLLANAIKYTRPQPQALIEVGVLRQEGTLVFYVRDNGVGFNMKYAHKLFGVFQRLHRPDEFEGTGVGLATVERIVHKHGGRVWAQGAVGQGATFYFTLPETAPETAAVSLSAADGEPVPGLNTPVAPHVLSL